MRRWAVLALLVFAVAGCSSSSSRAAKHRAPRDAEAARLAAISRTCREHGGTISAHGNCVVSYPGWPDQPLPIDYQTGAFLTSGAETARANCELAARDAAAGATAGQPWSTLPVFHDDSGVCTPGTP